MKYYVYVLECSDGRLYIGQTSDLKKRLENHCKHPSKQMKGRLPVELIGYMEVRNRAEAMELERKLKRFKSRAAVLRTINK